MVPQITALSVLGETKKLAVQIAVQKQFFVLFYSAKYCKFIRFKLLKSEQSWENIPTITELVITSAYIKKLKLNFNKQNQGQDFSWEYKHTSGIYTRHTPTWTHFNHSHIYTLQNQEFCFTHDESIWFSKYASHEDWVIQTHHLLTDHDLFVQYMTRSLHHILPITQFYHHPGLQEALWLHHVPN